MIILLAHEPDPWAPVLAREVELASGEPVGVLTPRDLSRPGWAITSPPDGAGRLVAAGRDVAESSVRLVVSLIGDVLPQELLWIREEDADYVASEMSAFLRYWLDSLGDRVLVPPGACSLAGPDHPVEVWAGVAGVRAAPARRIDWGAHREVAIVEGTVTGDPSPTLRRAVAAMARWADVPWLRAFFGPERDELWAVTPVPAPGQGVGQVAGVIASALEGRRAA